jgi:hypothetical protein
MSTTNSSNIPMPVAITMKIPSLFSAVGSGTTYSFETTADGFLKLGNGVSDIIKNSVSCTFTVKIDGENFILKKCSDKHVRVFMRYDWRSSVVFFKDGEKPEIIPLFPQKVDKKRTKGCVVKNILSLTPEAYFRGEDSNGWKLCVLGKPQDFTGHGIIPITGQVNRIQLDPDAEIVLGEMTNGIPDVIYRANPLYTKVDVMTVNNKIPTIRKDVLLDEIFNVWAPPNCTILSVENISPNIQSGKYAHLGIRKDDSTDNYTRILTIMRHGESIANIDMPSKPDSSSSDFDVAAWTTTLMEKTIAFSFDSNHPREGIVVYFTMQDGTRHYFKINQGHMETFNKMKGDEHLSKYTILFPY